MKPACAFLILLVSGSALAYQVKKTSDGTPLRWPVQAVAVHVNMDGAPAGIEPADAQAVVNASLATWQEAMPGDLVLNPEPSHLSAIDHDGDNVVRWIDDDEGWDDDYDPAALAVTLVSYIPSTGRITDADIVVHSGKYPWRTGDGACDARFDLQDIVTHEVGHLLGLAHEPANPEATMYPSAPTCEIQKRILDPDDLAGLRFLYLETAPPDTDGGCIAAPGPHAGGSAGLLIVLAVLVLFLALRGRRVAAGTALVALLLAGGSARATSARDLGVDDLSRAAAVVARGTVVARETVRVSGRLYTDATVEVAECWKGPCGARVVVRQLGGELGDEGLSVEGIAPFTPGAEVVVFLRARRDATLAPVGMAQGLMNVVGPRLIRDTRGLQLFGPGGAARPGRREELDLDEVRRQAARP